MLFFAPLSPFWHAVCHINRQTQKYGKGSPMTPHNQFIPKEEQMRHINFRNVLIVLAVVFLLGVGVNAFAGWGRAHYGPGPGWHHRGWGAGDSSYNRGNLSEDDYKKMDEDLQTARGAAISKGSYFG